MCASVRMHKRKRGPLKREMRGIRAERESGMRVCERERRRQGQGEGERWAEQKGWREERS